MLYFRRLRTSMEFNQFFATVLVEAAAKKKPTFSTRYFFPYMISAGFVLMEKRSADEGQGMEGSLKCFVIK